MLTSIRIQNFKQIVDWTVPLDDVTVFIGPNNSGKTTVLQALALWHFGMETWMSKNNPDHFDETKGVRYEVPISRQSVVHIPTVDIAQLWNELKTEKTITLEVTAITEKSRSVTSLSFYFDNEETLYCKRNQDFIKDYESLKKHFNTDTYYRSLSRVKLLYSMSGLTREEPLYTPDFIENLMGQGRTSELLRNLIFQLYTESKKNQSYEAILKKVSLNEVGGHWEKYTKTIKQLFSIDIKDPYTIKGVLNLDYSNQRGVKLDISSLDQGAMQALLVISFIYLFPRSTLLLDEPDAHLEIIRQRQMFQTIKQVAKEQNCQLIIATHSEVILEEAIQTDKVVAFYTQPVEINQSVNILKSLKQYPLNEYYLAKQKQWILYLEGSTDLLCLKAFAHKLEHPVLPYLDTAFVDYIDNKVSFAQNHFSTFFEAEPTIEGVCLVDCVPGLISSDKALKVVCWQYYEIENYFITLDTLVAYARSQAQIDPELAASAMQQAITFVDETLKSLEKPGLWDIKTKISDEVKPVFSKFLKNLTQQSADYIITSPIKNKGDFHRLIAFMPADQIDPEVTQKLDLIYDVAKRAETRQP